MTNINSFQKECVNACENFAKGSLGAELNFTETIGKKEKYLLGKLHYESQNIDIFIYVDEAGFMVNDEEWIICERPDYDSDNELITALVDKLRISCGVASPTE